MSKSLTQYITEAIRRDNKLIDLDEITYPDGTVVKMSDVEQKFRLSTMTVMNEFSYFAPALQNLVPIFTNGVNTMATDGVRIFMNPRFTNELSINECVFVLLHECMHCILNHMWREMHAGYTDHSRANIAADYEVNGILEFDGMIKPGTVKKLRGFIDKKYYNMPFEKIYQLIDSSAQKPKQQGDPNPQQGQQGQSGQQGGQSGSSGSGSGDNGDQNFDPDFIKGWNQAIADYNSGKLKI